MGLQNVVEVLNLLLSFEELRGLNSTFMEFLTKISPTVENPQVIVEKLHLVNEHQQLLQFVLLGWS